MSQEKPTQDETTEPIIIQEKITKKNGEIIIKKYLKGKVLGKGGFATCYEVTDLEKNKVLAAKIVSKASLTRKRALEKLLAEIKIHKSLQHAHIVQFEHVFEDKENVYILLEICPNQTLKELLKKQKRFTEAECATYLVQTIQALKYLHAKKIIHRDLKLGNLLLGKSFDIKVADLGLAAKIEQEGERRRTICGTPNYIAPEVLDKKIGHSYEVDIWSLGVICYTLLIGRPPFETNDTKATYRRILKANYAFPSNVMISENAKDMIKKILVLEPSKRPTLDEILEHPFVKAHAKTTSIQPSDMPTSLNKMGTIHQSTNFGITSDKAFLQTVTSPMERKDFQTDKVVDENELFGPGNYKKTDRNSAEPKNRLSEIKQDNMGNGLNGQSGKLGKVGQANSETCVTKWADYSSKYGLGYLLSNGSAGILFNDSSKITLSPDGTKFEYLKRSAEQNKEFLVTMNMDDYPKELQKKVVLLNYFKSYLEGTPVGADSDDKAKENERADLFGKTSSPPLVYVKKWMKTKYAIMFRLSNKMVQVDFTDKTQILLNPTTQIVAYKDKHGDMSHHPLATALESEFPEMVKRLKYTKEILIHLKAGPHIKTNGATESGAYKNPRAEQEGIYNHIAASDLYKEAVTEKLPHAYAMNGQVDA